MTARIGAPKTGGRKRGSLDKGERQLVPSEMAGDIMTVYKRLGGVKWLLQFAKDNPAEFLRQGLSRLMPAPQKDDPDFVQNNQFNIDMSDREAARRVAFALAKGLHDDPARIIEHEPVAEPEEVYINPNQWTPPTDAPDMLPPEPAHYAPVEDPDRTRWAQELPLSSQDRADRAVVRETVECTLETYRGGGGEQGGGAVQRQVVTRKPTVAEMRRRQSLL